MDRADLSRTIRATFDSSDLEPGWVFVPELLAVLDGIQSAITIVMEDLWGRAHTRGRVPADIQQMAALRLGDVRPGSFGATLQLEHPGSGQPELFDMQPTAVSRLMSGVEAYVAGRAPDLPPEAERHIAIAASRIQRSDHRLTLEGGRERRRVVVSAASVLHPETALAIEGPRKVRMSGRLLEIDYRDRTAEVWDPLGHMTRIRFSESQQGQVDAARKKQVAIEGVVDVSPSGRTGILSLEALAPVEFDHSFWRPRPLAELVQEQGVQPIAEPAALVATFWEEDDEEDFLAALRRWRQES